MIPVLSRHTTASIKRLVIELPFTLARRLRARALTPTHCSRTGNRHNEVRNYHGNVLASYA